MHFTLVMVDDGVFTDPVEGGHVISLCGYSPLTFPSIPDEYSPSYKIYYKGDRTILPQIPKSAEFGGGALCYVNTGFC